MLTGQQGPPVMKWRMPPSGKPTLMWMVSPRRGACPYTRTGSLWWVNRWLGRFAGRRDVRVEADRG